MLCIFSEYTMFFTYSYNNKSCVAMSWWPRDRLSSMHCFNSLKADRVLRLEVKHPSHKKTSSWQKIVGEMLNVVNSWSSTLQLIHSRLIGANYKIFLQKYGRLQVSVMYCKAHILYMKMLQCFVETVKYYDSYPKFLKTLECGSWPIDRHVR